jgi:hypothetical protein
MVFWVTPGIGAGAMTVRDGRVCRISKGGEHTNAPVAPDADNQNTVMYVKERPSYPKLYQPSVAPKIQAAFDSREPEIVSEAGSMNE